MEEETNVYYITFEDRDGNRFNFCHFETESLAVKAAQKTAEQLRFSATSIVMVWVRWTDYISRRDIVGIKV